LAALVACGGSQKGVQVIAAPTLTVVDDGDQPQRVVRIDVPVHTRERAEEHIDSVVAGHESRVQYPTVRMWSTYEVTDVAVDGTMTVHVTADRATYDGDIPDPKARQTVEAEVAALRRTDRTYRLSPSGVQTHDGAPKDADISKVDIRFPDAPIGIGAEWRVTSAFAIDGVKFNRTANYHLRGLDDATATVEVVFEADAPKQVIEMNPTNSVELTRGHAAGRGTYKIPLHGLVVTGGGMITSELAMSIAQQGLGRIGLEQTIEEQTTIKPADGATR
jgi:hypothetical protein